MSDPDVSSLRLGSYNIHKSVGTDGRRDPDRIREVIAELKADVMFIQEIDRRIGRRETTLPHPPEEDRIYSHAPIAVRPDSYGWHGNAIWVRPHIDITDTGRIELPQLEPRGAVWAHLHIAGQHEFFVVGTHLSLSEYFRKRQIHHIIGAAREMAGEKPVIIGGDFNAWRGSRARAYAFGPDCELVTPGNSYPSGRPFLSLDRFITIGLEERELDGFGVHISPTSRVASDHLPIYLDVNLEDI